MSLRRVRRRERRGSREEQMREEWRGEERRTGQVTRAMGIKCTLCALWYLGTLAWYELLVKSARVSGRPTPGQVMTVSKA